jgi:hypothetical protein
LPAGSGSVPAVPAAGPWPHFQQTLSQQKGSHNYGRLSACGVPRWNPKHAQIRAHNTKMVKFTSLVRR